MVQWSCLDDRVYPRQSLLLLREIASCLAPPRRYSRLSSHHRLYHSLVALLCQCENFHSKYFGGRGCYPTPMYARAWSQTISTPLHFSASRSPHLDLAPALQPAHRSFLPLFPGGQRRCSPLSSLLAALMVSPPSLLVSIPL